MRFTTRLKSGKATPFEAAAGVPGTSRICSTAQGILGYVKVATDPTSFEIKAYSASPPASLFELPSGAKVMSTKVAGHS
jgi:hypothetical protein